MKKIYSLLLIVTFTLQSIKTVAQQPAFYLVPSSQCASTTNTAQAAISVTVTGAASYTWSISNGTCNGVPTNVAPNGSVVNISFPCAGIFTINCTPYTGGGIPIPGAIPIKTTNIQASTFTANFGAMQTAQQGINFTNTTSNPGGTPLNYRWNFGDNSTSIAQNPSHTYSTAAIYTVTLIDSMAVSPFCASVYSSTVSVCFVSFTAPFPVYQNTAAVFNGYANPTSGTTTSYYWYTAGTPPTITGNNLTTVPVTYTNLGVHTVTFGYSTAVPFCSVATTQTINVMDPCTNFTYTQGSNGIVNLIPPANNTVSGTTYTWSFGGTGATPTASYLANGNYSITVIMSNSLCAPNTSTLLINVTSYTTACTLVPNYTFTQGGAGIVNFTSTSTGTHPGTSYTWNFGDNTSTSAVGSPTTTHVYPANGTYFATLTVNNNILPACVIPTVKTIVVTSYTLPCNLNASFTHTQGSNGQITFINTSTGTFPSTSYTWAFGAGQGTSAAVSPTYTYGTNGVKSVTLTVFNNNSSPQCTTVITQNINVTSNPTSCSLTASFTHTTGVNGFVNFSNTTTGTTGATSYTWNFGDATSVISSTAAHQYMLNGVYTVTLTADNNTTPTCMNSTIATVTINNVPPPCMLVAGFGSVNGAGGLVQFQNTSTGTSTTSIYNWNFGDGGTSTLTSPAHSYTNPGPFVASLNVQDGSCSNTYTALIFPCMQSVSFSHTVLANGVVNFASTSTGTNSNSIYNWYFGDGQTGTGVTTTHTYSANGTYYDSLIVINNTIQSCYFNRQRDTVVINTIPGPCTITAAFSHTMGSGGLVNFTNLSTATNTNASMTYIWNFGDGFFSTSIHPSHTYTNGGTHYISLQAANAGCISDSTIVAINVTGVSCSANSNFTLLPTTTPKYWNAIPSYPWNITKVQWNWGDGSTDSTLYTSHLYSVSANYSICLTVTVSCGATATTCSSYFVYKSTENQVADIIAVNVLKPDLLPTFMTAVENEDVRYTIFPNPNSGSFDVNLKGLSGSLVHVSVYDVVGQVIYERNEEIANEELRSNINLEGVSNGVFFVTISSETKSITKKIIVNK